MPTRRGTLQGKGKGKGRRLKVNNGSFCDWQGKETPALPDRGLEFEVVPDDQAEDVAVRRRLRQHAWEALDRAPSIGGVFHETYWPEELRPQLALLPRGQVDDAAEANKGALRDGIEKRWREQRAIEMMIAEAQGAFDGEDPCLPDVRHMIDHLRQELEDAHETAQWYLGPFELPEPDEETLEVVPALYERAQ
ncbi:MAG: hypothetical protein WEE64_00685 [Dehalococcoidia bacterium]